MFFFDFYKIDMTYVSTKLATDVLPSWENKTDLTLSDCFDLDFNYLVPRHLSLTLEYTIRAAYLCNTLTLLQKNNQEINADLMKQLLSAHNRAILLAYLYDKKLNVPREAAQCREDELFFRKILNQPGSPLQGQLHDPWPDDAHDDLHPFLNTQLIRNKHVVGNWIRVFTVRGRRVLNTTRPFIADSSPYHGFMNSFDEVANPFFAHFAWAFYAPRLVTNVGILLKHILPHPWMSKEEQHLDLRIRLYAHFQRRCFELANDSVWLVSGALCCFLLLGSLVPVANYLVAVLYAYDIVIAALRAFIELRRLYQLRQEYKDANVPMELQKELHVHIAYERRRLYLNVGYMTALSVAIALTIPILAASGPLFPLVGAALLIAVTLISFIALKLNERTKPVTQTPATSPYRFFKAAENAKPPLAEPPIEVNLSNLAPGF